MEQNKQFTPLTKAEEQEVLEILARIRSGLAIPVESQFEEPAHLLNSGAFNVKK